MALIQATNPTTVTTVNDLFYSQYISRVVRDVAREQLIGQEFVNVVDLTDEGISVQSSKTGGTRRTVAWNAALKAVVRAAKALPVALAGVAGTVLTAAPFGSYVKNYFAGGYVDWQNGPDVVRRFILSSEGTTITIGLPFAGMPADAEVTVYPGCDHTLSTCHNKFANAINYGGQPWATGVNPFDGTPIF